MSEMSALGVSDVKDVVYCEWSEEEGFYYRTMDDCIQEKREGYIN